MEKVLPSFQYEPLDFIPEPKTLDEEKEKGNTDGVGPSGTRTKKEEPIDLKEGRIVPRKGLLVWDMHQNKL